VGGRTTRFVLAIDRYRPVEPEPGGRRAEAGEPPAADRAFADPVRLRLVTRLPRGMSASLSDNPVVGTASTLVVRTAARTPPASYRLVLEAHGGGETARASMRLIVTAPRRTAFAIGGGVSRALTPGSKVAINVAFTNPYAFTLAIMGFRVNVRGIAAPRASAAYPCTGRDFALRPFSGRYGFRLAPRSRNTLGSLGFPSTQWPQLGMIDRPVNQDGCMRATVILGYTDIARVAIR
jgi:hypothetical protein